MGDARHLPPSAQEAMRSRAVAALVAGRDREGVAAVFGVSLKAVDKWWAKWQAGGREALVMHPRGKPAGVHQVLGEAHDGRPLPHDAAPDRTALLPATPRRPLTAGRPLTADRAARRCRPVAPPAHTFLVAAQHGAVLSVVRSTLRAGRDHWCDGGSFMAGEYPEFRLRLPGGDGIDRARGVLLDKTGTNGSRKFLVRRLPRT